ncbi:MAG: S-methyl-5-thioribose-1-phosphate isomerase [Alphaproteobacteria bacterium]|nr:S-methyl-5-thioribose-1-phosphate isomerase [Alphaproteobacteria bacterium]
MKIGDKHYRTIWLADDGWSVKVIDQTFLPHQFEVMRLTDVAEAALAISSMVVRGAPLIGATAAYGMALATHADSSDQAICTAYAKLLATRPTAVNLRWALDDMRRRLLAAPENQRREVAYARAADICDDDVATCQGIANHGCPLIEEVFKRKDSAGPVNILTHCNAGWLATVDWGTALAPVYAAYDAGIPVHVWVDETRPRNQGAALTAYELGSHGVPYTVIVDNAGGHLMQHGRVDLCITGTDRTSAHGDVCNKIGTYLKALAAHDNGVPFYVGLPHSTIDWNIGNGVSDIPIEEREGCEVSHIHGVTETGRMTTVRLVPEGAPVDNFAFDVTPARLVTGLITERGVCNASREGLLGLYPERAETAA